MDHCVKLGKLIKTDSFNQFSTLLNHCYTRLSRTHLWLLLFQIINSRVEAPSNYIHEILRFDAEINAFYNNKNRYPQFNGMSPLMAACEMSKIQAVASLLECQKIRISIADDKGENCMFYALKNQSEDDCYKMINAIVSRDQTLANSTNFEGNSILIQALEKKSLRVVQLLLKNSADPNFKSKQSGDTALHKALLNNTNNCEKKKDIILLLLNYKADPSILNKQQKSCFDIAKQVNFQFDWLVQLYQQKQNQQSYQQYVACHQQMNSVTKQDQNSINQNFSIQFSSQSDQSQFSIDKLTQQIQNLSKFCQKRHEESWKDIQYLYHQLGKIGEQMNLKIDIIGSYATGIWTPYSDIDVVFTNSDTSYIKIDEALLKIYSVLKKRQKQLGIKQIYYNNSTGNSFSNIKIDLERKLNLRKIDITIFQKKNNGQKYVRYICDRLNYNPFIKPVFFCLHKLLRSFNLGNPTKNGLKTYAIFLMILISAQRCKPTSSGQLLINTIYFYAHCFIYEKQQDGTLKINIYDPLNQNNNVGGRKTDVIKLHQMFKATDYGLRMAGGRNILQYLFSLHNIFEF